MDYEIKDYSKFYIVEAFFILLKEYKYENITVSDIAYRAGIGRATFYRKFNSKEEIINYYLTMNTEHFNSITKFIPRCKEDYFEIVKHALIKFKEEKEKIKLLILNHLEHFYYDFVIDNLQLHMLTINETPNNKYIAAGFAGLITNISMEWLKSDCIESVDEIARIIINLLMLE